MEPDIELPPDVYLEITGPDGKLTRFPITKKTVTIGRDPACDLHLQDEYVSRKHCQIVFRGDHFTAIDLGSLNKTVFKGKEYIQKNLMSGNRLNLGKTQIRFVWENSLEWLRAHGLMAPPPEEDEPDSGPG